jgi:hypothetical protein
MSPRLFGFAADSAATSLVAAGVVFALWLAVTAAAFMIVTSPVRGEAKLHPMRSTRALRRVARSSSP